jgi:Tfp pilus assembly protein PilX
MAIKTDGILKDQTGAAIIVALIMMIVLTLIGLASTFTSTFEIKLSGNKRGATDAFYAADSGVNVVTARIENFNLNSYDPGTNKYNPFTDSENINPTQATANIEYYPTEKAAPRGLGYSAVNLEYAHYLVESTGQDQTNTSSTRSSAIIQEKVVRLMPTQ